MKTSIKPLKELLDSVRDIEGFPIGSDDDILALSRPPYYTACPNPYIRDFVKEYGRTYDEESDDYHREPFVGDISEGKNNAIYNAHSYHTKVPHKAIIPFLNHFTQKGDLVLDAFCGTGMTGYAANLTGRNAIVADISPIAAFIASVYAGKFSSGLYTYTARKILEEVEKECQWMYRTKHITGGYGDIEYMVWSDLFLCPYCLEEYVFYEVASDSNTDKVHKEFSCPACKAIITKKQSKRAFINFSDKLIGENIEQTKQVPVLIVYQMDGERMTKKPDSFDLELIKKIDELEIPFWVPTARMPEGDETRRNDKYGYTHVHHFYTKRSMFSIGLAYEKISKVDEQLKPLMLFTFEQAVLGLSRIARYVPTHFSQVNQYLSGTLYIGSQIVEPSLRYVIDGKISRLSKVFEEIEACHTQSISLSSTQSITDLSNCPSMSFDYIFTDPPFGSNLMYSELNIFWESWSKVVTNNQSEAIINSSQNKSSTEYSKLMREGFSEYFRVLKPGRWITVVFHNSKSEIWNILQDSISRAGFIIAQVSVLDKQHSSFKQITSPGAVKNDLVISAYKPKHNFSETFLEFAGEGLEEEFIKMHLDHLKSEPSVERTEQMLYSKLLAYYVQRSYTVKYDSSTFYKMLHENFVEEDGYWFNNYQIDQYREFKKKLHLESIDDIKSGQMVLFIQDEKSAIIWLNSFLIEPKDFKEIHPAYTKIATIAGDNVPDIKGLLDDNFIFEYGRYRRPQNEEEKISINEKRQRELKREFDALLLEARGSKKTIKDCRKQAVIYGFEQCYKSNKFQDILDLAARLDKKIIENDSEINEFIEVAELKVEGF